MWKTVLLKKSICQESCWVNAFVKKVFYLKKKNNFVVKKIMVKRVFGGEKWENSFLVKKGVLWTKIFGEQSFFGETSFSIKKCFSKKIVFWRKQKVIEKIFLGAKKLYCKKKSFLVTVVTTVITVTSITTIT